jgi:hypothetical protein
MKPIFCISITLILSACFQQQESVRIYSPALSPELDQNNNSDSVNDENNSSANDDEGSDLPDHMYFGPNGELVAGCPSTLLQRNDGQFISCANDHDTILDAYIDIFENYPEQYPDVIERYRAYCSGSEPIGVFSIECNPENSPGTEMEDKWFKPHITCAD